jgi:hypothetical protein
MALPVVLFPLLCYWRGVSNSGECLQNSASFFKNAPGHLLRKFRAIVWLYHFDGGLPVDR